MEGLNSVFFFPWVGKNYHKGINGKKILILGESHICGGCKSQCGDLNIVDDTCRNHTIDAVQAFLNYKKGENTSPFSNWMNTYTKFSNVFHNKQLNPEETVDFWHSILFYSYVQFSTDKARISPEGDEFINSEKAFFEILNHHKPDLVIAWGNRLWSHLPYTGEYGVLIQTSRINDGKGFYYYIGGDKKIPIFYVYHPSSSHFNYSSHDLIREAFEQI